MRPNVVCFIHGQSVPKVYLAAQIGLARFIVASRGVRNFAHVNPAKLSPDLQTHINLVVPMPRRLCRRAASVRCVISHATSRRCIISRFQQGQLLRSSTPKSGCGLFRLRSKHSQNSPAQSYAQNTHVMHTRSTCWFWPKPGQMPLKRVPLS